MNEVRASDEPRADETGRRISVGHELRRAREVRHVTLAQLAAETRIALRHLEALEQDRLDDLPGRLYARNFVRTVARTLGADEQELLDYFDYQSGHAAASGEVADEEGRQAARRRVAFGALAGAVLVIVAALAFALGGGESEQVEPEPPASREAAGPARAGRPAAAERDAEGESTSGEPAATEAEPPPAEAVAVPVTETAVDRRSAEPAPAGPPPSATEPAARPRSAAASRERSEAREPQRRLEERAEASVTARSPVETREPAPAAAEREEPAPAAAEREEPAAVAASPPRTAPPPPATSEEAGPRVRLAFTGPSWVEIVPEGSGEQVMGLKTAGQEVDFELESAVEVTVANAGNVQLWLDGQAARPLGAPGERRTLRLDARNWRSYLK